MNWIDSHRRVDKGATVGNRRVNPWVSAGGKTGISPLEIGTKKQKVLENVKSGI